MRHNELSRSAWRRKTVWEMLPPVWVVFVRTLKQFAQNATEVSMVKSAVDANRMKYVPQRMSASKILAVLFKGKTVTLRNAAKDFAI